MRGTEGQLTRSAIVEPYVDVSRLDIVGVVLRVDERAPREPLPMPTPSPTNSTTGDDTATADDSATIDDSATPDERAVP